MILLWNAAVLTCPINSSRGSEIIKKLSGTWRVAAVESNTWNQYTKKKEDGHFLH